MSLEELEFAALRLSVSERARLAKRLLSSLDSVPSAEEAWLSLAQERYEAVTNGAMATIPADDVFAKARQALVEG